MSGPVIQPSHLQADRAILVSDLIDKGLPGKTLSGIELVSFGAVYFNRRRIAQDAEMKNGDWLRVHPNPRRFPGALWDWPSRIIYEDGDFLILDKPAGVPVHATCDNRRENVIAFLQPNYDQPLMLCHRLDIGTQGLMAIAKTREFCQGFGGWMANRQIIKRYRALVDKPVPLGEVVHYMAPGDRAPHLVSLQEQDGWKVCRLEVTACRSVGFAHELEITLGTGRHHQIRAQLSALGFPVLGDDIYGTAPSAGAEQDERVALQAFALEFPDGRRFEIPSSWESHRTTGG